VTNIKQRVPQQLGEARTRQYVDVVNLQQFAMRLVQAHENVVGLTSDVEYPNRTWLKKALPIRHPTGVAKEPPPTSSTPPSVSP
jgi:hypothetical protein